MFNRTPYALTPDQEYAVRSGKTPKPQGSKIVLAPFIDRLTENRWPYWTENSLVVDPAFIMRAYSKAVIIGWYMVQPTRLHLTMSKNHSTMWSEPGQYSPTPIHYHVHDADLMPILREADRGEIIGDFTVVKRGTKYGIRLITNG